MTLDSHAMLTPRRPGRLVLWVAACVAAHGSCALAQQPATPTTVSQLDLHAELANVQAQLELIRTHNELLREEVRLLERQRALLVEQVNASRRTLLEHGLLSADEARAMGLALPVQEQQSAAGIEGPEPFDPADFASADPLSSPSALRAGLVRSYDKELGPISRADAAAEESYQDAVARWCRSAAKQFRGEVEWLVSLEAMERGTRGGRRETTVLVRVVDASSGLDVGEAERVAIPERLALRVERSPQTRRWLVRASVAAEPRYAPGRADEGIFNEPPLIGPYAEWGWRFAWRQVTPAEHARPKPTNE